MAVMNAPGSPVVLRRQPVIPDFSQISPETIAALKALGGQVTPEELQDESYLKPELAEDEGRKTTGTVEADLKSQARKTEALDESEWVKALQNLRLHPTPGLKTQRQDVDILRGGVAKLGEEHLRGIPQGSMLDLAPFLAFSDSMYGSNYLPGYKGPPGRAQRAELANMGGLLQRAEKGLSDTEKELMKTQLSDYWQSVFGLGGGVTRTAARGAAGGPGPDGLTPFQQYTLGRNADRDQKDIEEKVQAFVKERGDELGAVTTNLKYLNNIMGAYGEDASHYTFKLPGGKSFRMRKGVDFINQLTGDTNAVEFNQALENLSQDIMRKDIGSQRTKAEIQGIARKIGNRMFSTPAELRHYLTQLSELLKQTALDNVTAMPRDQREHYDKLNVTKYENEYGGLTFGAEGELKPATKPPPAVGTIKGGYKFKGGDPSDQNNWEKVQ